MENLTIRQETEKDLRERRSEVQRQEHRIQQKEESLDRKIDNLEAKEEKDESDYQKIAEARSEELRIKASYDELSSKVTECTVTFDDLASVIELWTGIPASKIAENDLVKLSTLEDRIKERIIGQDEAARLVANAVKRSRVQTTPHRRPASFIFVGPTFAVYP